MPITKRVSCFRKVQGRHRKEWYQNDAERNAILSCSSVISIHSVFISVFTGLLPSFRCSLCSWLCFGCGGARSGLGRDKIRISNRVFPSRLRRPNFAFAATPGVIPIPLRVILIHSQKLSFASRACLETKRLLRKLYCPRY